MFERDLELVEEGIFQPPFGEAGVFNQQGDRDLAERMVVQVDLCGVCAVDVFLRRDHSGGSKLRNGDKLGCCHRVRKTLTKLKHRILFNYNRLHANKIQPHGGGNRGDWGGGNEKTVSVRRFAMRSLGLAQVRIRRRLANGYGNQGTTLDL